MVRERGRWLKVERAVCVMVVAALLTGTSGCGVLDKGAKLAKEAFDPGIPGPKPVTAEEAAQLSDEQIQQRLDFVVERLEDNRTHAAWWYYGFLAVNAGGIIAGAATAPFAETSDDQTYDILNASLGVIGTGYMLAAPLPGRSGADPIFEKPFLTHEDRAKQLALGEEILYGAAGRARQRTGWLMTTGNIALNAAAASILLAKESYDNAAMLFFINTAVGEAQILLTPWEPETSWHEYQQFVATGGAPTEPQARWSLAPLASGKGLALQYQF
jgi:hypothetical protein